MRTIDRNVNAVSGHHLVGGCPVLVLRPKDRSIVVDGPEALDFVIREYISIIAIEHVNGLRPTNLKQKITLAIDVIRRHALWRSHEYEDVFLPDLRVDTVARDLLDFLETAVK